jgi:hypothetical protein
MAYPISDVPRRIVYSGSAGVGPYAFTFEVLAATDIAVYKNGTLLTLTTDYTVSINTGTGTGTVTLVVAATGSDQITLVGDRAIERTSDFVTGGDLFANTLNTELDSLTIFAQQVDEKADRAIKAPVTDPTTINMTLPAQATRASKALGFNASGNPTQSSSTLAAIDAAVTTVQTLAAAAPGSSAGISHIASGTGAVATTVQAKLRETVSVKDFGAVGDGVTDDTAAIQAAINYAQQIKAWVYFPPVQFAYMVTGLTIGQAGTNYTCHFQGGGFDPSGASQPLTGQYSGQSMIKLINGSNTSLLTIHEDAAQPQFRNITFLGNRAAQSGTSYCVYMPDAVATPGRYYYACWMMDCFVVDGRSGGIFIGDNRGSGNYDNVWVQYCGTTTSDAAITVKCFDQQFSDLQVGPNPGKGMFLGAVTQIQILNSVFFMNDLHMQVDEGVGNLQVTQTVFDEATTDGVVLTRGTGSGAYGARVFTNCTWQRNSKGATDTYSDIVVFGDRRLILDSPSFVGDFGQGWLPKYNIECDNALQSTHIRITTPMLESNAGATAATAFTNQWFSLAYAGNRTAYVSPWAGQNQLSVVFNDVEEVQFTPAAMSLVGAALCDPLYTTPVAVNGGTTTMTAAQHNCILLPAAGLTTYTVELPPPQGDGQIVRISSSEAITTLTVSAQSPATTVLNSSVSLSAGGSVAFIYVAGGTTWARI